MGKTAADRDRGNDNKNTLPEAKKCYSSQCLERCAAVLAVSQLPLLMDPVKKVTLIILYWLYRVESYSRFLS